MTRSAIPKLHVALALALLSGPAGACSGDEQDTHAVQATSQPKHTNQLINATSPYLQQHAHNPVDWHEWGPIALEKARSEGKPIFLSIGYSACHWCHVMAHESFENEEIAALMNKYFVCIKVDREERPDIDEIYMRATVMMNGGQGGWPMSVWLTPELQPFAAGTYFPPTARFGRPGFTEVCEQLGQAWKNQRQAIVAQAGRITTALNQNLIATVDPNASLTLEIIDQAVKQLAQAFDLNYGGISGGGTNKFPPSMAMDLMLRSAHRNRKVEAIEQRLVGLVNLTLEKMAHGGVYDQLGGGIHRYSTDIQWHVPHFEKMLYDQALVSDIYLDGYLYTHNRLHARIAREIFDYVIDDLQSPEGGLYSTRDADSEGEEGKYYVWTKKEIIDALGDEEGELFCSYYDVSSTGNWRDPHNPDEPKNILRVLRDVDIVAKLNKVEPADLRKRLAAASVKLRLQRVKRIPPGLDDKILCAWNGLMIGSLARGGRVLKEPRYVHAAARVASFLLDKQYINGRLHRSYRDGKTLETAFLNDYAFLIDGLLDLYEATFEKRWLEQAVELNQIVTRHFWDEQAGGYFFTADDHEKLIARTKEARDGAIPSGNSVQLMNLNRLAVMLGDTKLRDMAQKTIDAFAGDVVRSPGASERLLGAVEFALAGSIEIAIVGDPEDAATQALLERVYSTYLPNRVLMLHNPKRPSDSIQSPLLENRPAVDGKPTAYVCRDYLCKLPVTTPEDLGKQLKEW